MDVNISYAMWVQPPKTRLPEVWKGPRHPCTPPRALQAEGLQVERKETPR